MRQAWLSPPNYIDISSSKQFFYWISKYNCQSYAAFLATLLYMIYFFSVVDDTIRDWFLLIQVIVSLASVNKYPKVLFVKGTHYSIDTYK